MEYYSQYLKLYKRFIDDIFATWCGALLEFLSIKPDFAKQEFCCEGVGHVIFHLRPGWVSQF